MKHECDQATGWVAWGWGEEAMKNLSELVSAFYDIDGAMAKPLARGRLIGTVTAFPSRIASCLRLLYTVVTVCYLYSCARWANWCCSRLWEAVNHGDENIYHRLSITLNLRDLDGYPA